MPATTAEIVAAVRAHALANYEKGGWDVLIECYDDAQIVEEMGDAKTAEQAIKTVGKSLGVFDEYRKDIQATAF